MSEVRLKAPSVSTLANERLKQSEYTKEQNFEMIDYKAFQASRENRLMSWKADQTGKGKVSIGRGDMNSMKTDEDRNNLLLPAGWRVTVDSMVFKIAKEQ